MSFHRTLFMTLLVDDLQPLVSHGGKPFGGYLRKEMERPCHDDMAAALEVTPTKTLSPLLTAREHNATRHGVLDT